MTETKNGYYYECMISDNTKYVLLDNETAIRATAPNLDGIISIKQKYGWGVIHRASYDGKQLKIGKVLE